MYTAPQFLKRFSREKHKSKDCITVPLLMHTDQWQQNKQEHGKPRQWLVSIKQGRYLTDVDARR